MERSFPERFPPTEFPRLALNLELHFWFTDEDRLAGMARCNSKNQALGGYTVARSRAKGRLVDWSRIALDWTNARRAGLALLLLAAALVPPAFGAPRPADPPYRGVRIEQACKLGTSR